MLRRQFLGGALVLGAAAPLRPIWAAEALWQPEAPTPRAFMARAIELSRTGVERGEGTPYGAVIVRDGRIVGEGWNRTYLKGDATAHAEMEAIQDAAKRLGTRNLAGCVIFTNGGTPCPMCQGGSYFANLDRIFYAHTADAITDFGSPRLGGC